VSKYKTLYPFYVAFIQFADETPSFDPFVIL